MITEALRHFPGLGPARLARLHAAGVRTWTDLLAMTPQVQTRLWEKLRAECHRCLTALEAGDVRYFVDRFAAEDKWRILSHFLQDATYFDIETEGLEFDAPVTVIGCWHRGRLWTFMEGENLDGFLELLDDATLLVSFNGNSFDVPRMLNAFHIPRLPCPHLDLRWICYHRGWKGSLKEIAGSRGISRPPDVVSVDGAVAVQLWNMWRYRQDASARDRLLRYCCADVILLVQLAQHLADQERAAPSDLWLELPPARHSQLRFSA